jgi:hypothetical protein
MARLTQLVVDSRRPSSVARFWAAALDDFEIPPTTTKRLPASLPSGSRLRPTHASSSMDRPSRSASKRSTSRRWRSGPYTLTSRRQTESTNGAALFRSQPRSFKSSRVTRGCVTPKATTSASRTRTRRSGGILSTVAAARSGTPERSMGMGCARACYRWFASTAMNW